VAYIITNELDIKIKSLKINVQGDLNPGRLLSGDSAERAGFTDIRVKLDVDSDADQTFLGQW